LNLLLEVFPKHIAEALRDGRKVEPEHHDCVTIFFSDIVGFTTIAGSVSVLKVADMLDRLYLRFDSLSRTYDVFKIETIGDAWMGVTNLVKDQPDHAKRLAQFAIAAVQAASETPIDLDDLSRGNVQIRVGFHSGPVLSNVIGSRNPKFSIFGDTVNTSARMESHSLPGRIQCSERAAELLKSQGPEVPLAYRGTIHVKGKGEMNTYWVNEVANVAKASSALKDIQEGDKKYVDDAEESEGQNGMVGDDDLPPV
jgi:class 3 adenylate cyclase